VLLITGEYPPMSGGVGAYTAELAAALAGRGRRVSVLTSVAAGVAHAGPVSVYPIVANWGWGVGQQARELAQRIGAGWVHVQYQTAAYGMRPAINFAPGGWRRSGLRVAWTYHDLLVPYLFPKAGNRLRRWVTDRPARVCDLTIVTNEGDRRHLAEVARRLVCIPIGSNIAPRPVSAAERAAVRARWGAQEGDLLVGYFGFLNRSKGGLVLVEALSRVAQARTDVRLLLIGEQVGASDATNRAYLEEVKAAIDRLGLAGRVAWTGALPDAEISAHLAACDVLLLPYVDGASLRRGSLMAALAHGCAIVTTTPQAPIAELVDGRDLLYVPPDDPAAAATAVLRLAADVGQAAALRTNSRQAAVAFTWDAIAAAHEREYDAV
jgi:glycosyltransferase involved in cell wall biosynthesis